MLEAFFVVFPDVDGQLCADWRKSNRKIVKDAKAMAKCLWSVDLLGNVKASVASDYGTGGSPEVVTIVGNLKGDFFELTAANFHFSAPTLKLKLTGSPSSTKSEVNSPQASAPSPSPQPSMTSTPLAKTISMQKKKTITCTKGKTTKKVTGLSPKCPPGYKKK